MTFANLQYAVLSAAAALVTSIVFVSAAIGPVAHIA